MSRLTIQIKLGTVVDPKRHGLNVDEVASNAKFADELQRRMEAQFPEQTISIERDPFRSAGGYSVTYTATSVDARGNVVHNSGVGDVVSSLYNDEAAWLVRKK
jgi:hypothetical protein